MWPPLRALRLHWPEYLLEGAGLALILFVSATITAVVETQFRPGLPSIARRAIEGVAIAGTLVGLIYSPLGRRSGAHFNPAVTLTFFALRKVDAWDAVYYALFQVFGAVFGIAVAGLLIGKALQDPPVMWIVTQPGPLGWGVAFLAEMAIAFILMTTILFVGGRPSIARYTGWFAGGLVFLYICLEAPVSGFSMNPARTFASAAASGSWTDFWVYVVAPPAGMLAAALVSKLIPAAAVMSCAKLNHDDRTHCIHCGFRPEEKAHV